MRQEKQLLLDEVSECVTTENTWIVTRYQRLTAAVAGDFRRQLREQGCDFKVVRKRLLVKATEQAGVPLELSQLQGHIGVVTAGEDPVAASKIVIDFDAVEVLAGHIEGVLYSAADVEKLSKLPDMQTMRAQVLGLFEAPMSQTLAVVEALLTSMPHLLQNRAKEQE